GLTDAAAISLAKQVFAENMKRGSGNWTDVSSVNVTLDRNNNRAVVDVASSVKTTFAAVSGIKTMGTPGSATAVFESRDIEVSLQLDLTGSMCDAGPAPCINHPKIQGLKDATKDLVDILLPDSPGTQKIRLAYAPFTAGVNLGTYQSAVADGRTTADHCVYERVSTSNQATDQVPAGNDSYMIAADLKAAPHNVHNPRNCPNAPVIPLTDDKVLLKNTVDTYVADGYTAGHNGTAWAWNLISPN
ncbi:unnamed protein product, partial [Phaeothamnion confervicola]